jgi:hypothetical protein
MRTNSVGCVVVGTLLLVAFLGDYFVRREEKRRRADFIANRQQDAFNAFHPLHFGNLDRDSVWKLLTEIALIYNVPPSCLRPEDRFAVELRALFLRLDTRAETIQETYEGRRRAAGYNTTSYPRTIAEYILGILSPGEHTTVSNPLRRD